MAENAPLRLLCQVESFSIEDHVLVCNIPSLLSENVTSRFNLHLKDSLLNTDSYKFTKGRLIVVEVSGLNKVSFDKIQTEEGNKIVVGDCHIEVDSVEIWLLDSELKPEGKYYLEGVK